MPDITDLRAQLRDRQKKEQLGRESYYICLDPDLVREQAEAKAELDELQGAIDETKKQTRVDGRLGSGPRDDRRPELGEIQKRIDALDEQIRQATIRLEFRALTAIRYNALVSEHPDSNDSTNADAVDAFCDALAEQCFKGCYRGDSDAKEDIGLSEIREGLTFGEWEPVQYLVLGLNRRKVDVPFSRRRSAATRRSGSTSTPA